MTGLKKKLIIIGFSGFAKEVYWLASRIGIDVHGFLDDNSLVHGAFFDHCMVLGSISDWKLYEDCVFVIAIGNPRVRKKVLKKMLIDGTPEFVRLIDPQAILDSDFVNVGPGSIICAGTVCTVNISIGAHVIVNLNCTIGHDVVIDDYATIAPMVAISGNVHVGERVEVGTGASIRQGLILESGSMLGMGSVLTKSIKENIIFFGNPAKAFKTLPVDEV